VTDELERLGVRYGLRASAVEQLRRLVDLLARDPLAPTSIRDPRRIVEDHVADSLVALELDVVHNAGRLADLGSGAGLPGLPLAIALPHVDFSLVESVRRKCEFIDRAISSCGVANARSVHARAEGWPEGLAGFDLVTARALAPLPVLAEYAAPLLRVGGTAVFWRGRRDPEDEEAGAVAAAQLGLHVTEIARVWPYPAATHRHLHLMSKVMQTPPRFPRRPGMAAKRPLGPHASASGRAGSDRARR
jgi:16S rRNA (guanine527-N7)-methyltransferase